MKKSINLSDKNFQFFLAGSTQVESLEAGAVQFGGATLFNGVVKSNIQAGDSVEVTENNTLAVFVPSTMDVDSIASNEALMQNINLVRTVFDGLFLSTGRGHDIEATDTKGSWYSEDQKKVVVEDIFIISIKVNEVTDEDVYSLRYLANKIKDSMNQEGVSIMINEALAIV